MILDDNTIKEIIDGDTEKLVNNAKKFGESLCSYERKVWSKSGEYITIDDKKEYLTTSQIRNVFGEVKRIQMNASEENFDFHRFLLLRPKLAYAAKRAGSKGAKELQIVIDKAIVKVGRDARKFQNFCDFFEATLAYFKAAGGK